MPLELTDLPNNIIILITTRTFITTKGSSYCRFLDAMPTLILFIVNALYG
jgi:hypothetical protein